MSYVLALLGFAVLIILHEAGHFAAAKAVGMRVERFSLFFGPMFVKRQIGETEYGIGVIPLGGYVKITGMSPEEVFETPSIEARAYVNQPVWKRIVVIAAGPAVNLVLAFLLAMVFFIGSGVHHVTNSSGGWAYSVGSLTSQSAAKGKLQAGDQIVRIDGIAANDPVVIHRLIEKHTCAGGAHVNNCQATSAVTLVVNRHGVLRTVRVVPRWSAAHKSMLVGFRFAYKMTGNSLAWSAGASITGLWNVTKATVSTIARIFQPRERARLHSIVGAVHIAQQSIASSWTQGIEIIALVSLSLGIINLFPFLPLDGGHIFWAVVEKIRGRKVSLVVMERASLVGIALIGLLFVIGLSNDISGLAGSGFGAQ